MCPLNSIFLYYFLYEARSCTQSTWIFALVYSSLQANLYVNVKKPGLALKNEPVPPMGSLAAWGWCRPLAASGTSSRGGGVARLGGLGGLHLVCASLACGLLLLCLAGNLFLCGAYGCPGVMHYVWLPGTAAAFRSRTLPLQLLGAVDCRPSTILITPTNVHLQVTNSHSHTHSTQNTLNSTHMLNQPPTSTSTRNSSTWLKVIQTQVIVKSMWPIYFKSGFNKVNHAIRILF
ncbi:hypothetical protein GOODEAATRI_033220 [Goodea atripinnis]|uniref:Uncharacterized protein n=1 Tax=Goodea atripinnis TaxID=208336 RepID=A0ABV0PTQ3_9TELE